MNYLIREAHSFAQRIDELEREYPRIREIKRGISIILSIEPHLFFCIDNEPTEFRVLRTDVLTDLEDILPVLDVVFEIIEVDERKIVDLLDVRVVETPDLPF